MEFMPLLLGITYIQKTVNNHQTTKIMTKGDTCVFENIKSQYKMDFLEIGMNVLVNKNAARVTGVSGSGLKATLINSKKSISFHPTWETAYYDSNWNIIADYRKNKR